MPRAIEAEAKYAFCVNSDPGANLQMSFPRWGQRKNIGTCPRTPLACSCPRALLFPHLCTRIARASELKHLPEKASHLAQMPPFPGDRILIMKQPWLRKILEREKTLEIRSQPLSVGDYWLGHKEIIYGKIKLGKGDCLFSRSCTLTYMHSDPLSPPAGSKWRIACMGTAEQVNLHG